MKTIVRLTTGLLVCFSFTCGTVVAFATESVCQLQEVGSTENEITKRYEKYKSNAKLIDAYLKGVARGFELGVQGRGAHLPISFQISEEGAGMNGLTVGYRHGLAVYCRMAGRDAKYREP